MSDKSIIIMATKMACLALILELQVHSVHALTLRAQEAAEPTDDTWDIPIIKDELASINPELALHLPPGMPIYGGETAGIFREDQPVAIKDTKIYWAGGNQEPSCNNPTTVRDFLGASGLPLSDFGSVGEAVKELVEFSYDFYKKLVQRAVALKSKTLLICPGQSPAYLGLAMKNFPELYNPDVVEVLPLAHSQEHMDLSDADGGALDAYCQRLANAGVVDKMVGDHTDIVILDLVHTGAGLIALHKILDHCAEKWDKSMSISWGIFSNSSMMKRGERVFGKSIDETKVIVEAQFGEKARQQLSIDNFRENIVDKQIHYLDQTNAFKAFFPRLMPKFQKHKWSADDYDLRSLTQWRNTGMFNPVAQMVKAVSKAYDNGMAVEDTDWYKKNIDKLGHIETTCQDVSEMNSVACEMQRLGGPGLSEVSAKHDTEKPLCKDVDEICGIAEMFESAVTAYRASRTGPGCKFERSGHAFDALVKLLDEEVTLVRKAGVYGLPKDRVDVFSKNGRPLFMLTEAFFSEPRPVVEVTASDEGKINKIKMVGVKKDI